MHNLNKKGAVSFIIELFIGAVLIMIIVAASYYFAGQSNIQATAIVYAQNSKTNCMVNLNTLMQSDKFLEEGKTATVLSRSYDKSLAESNDATQELLTSRLKEITRELSKMLPETRFGLRIYNYCRDITKDCKAKDKHTLATINSGFEENTGKEYDDESRYESCVYPLPVICDPEKYTAVLADGTPSTEVETCTIFAEMRLNY